MVQRQFGEILCERCQIGTGSNLWPAAGRAKLSTYQPSFWNCPRQAWVVTEQDQISLSMTIPFGPKSYIIATKLPHNSQPYLQQQILHKNQAIHLPFQVIQIQISMQTFDTCSKVILTY